MTELEVQSIINQTTKAGTNEKLKQVDTLILSNQEKVFDQIMKLIEEKDYIWCKTNVDNFYETVQNFDFIGTVIVETSDIPKQQHEKLTEMIRTLDSQGVATVLVNNHINFPVGNYDLVSVLETGSIEELRGRVVTNITYHKKLTKVDEIIEDQHTEELEEQLKMAGQVQRDFLPSGLPNNKYVQFASIFKPADWVSGDIYDARRLDEQHIGFYIADAVGHSMPAALLTMFLKQAMVMRETVGNDYRIFSPVEVISSLNNKMAEQHLSGSLFATCCYCLLNIRTMQLQFARAGHPYPILINKNNKIKQLQGRGSLLGVFKDAEFVQETVQLERGDKLFMYSDGAERIIGTPQDNGDLDLHEDFASLTELSIEKMVDMFDIMVRNRSVTGVERDDITILGLEIL